MGKDKEIKLDELREGDIVLFHTKGFFNLISKSIRQLTGSYWNHVGLLICEPFWTGIMSWTVVEALGKGMIGNPLSKYIGNPLYDLKIVRVKERAFKDKIEHQKAISIAIHKMTSLIGTKYDYFAIVYLGIRYTIRGIWNVLGKWLPKNWNPFQSRYKFFCSEAVCYSYFETSSKQKNLFAGKKYPKAKCDTITPKDCGKTKYVKYISGNKRNRV